MDVPRTINLSAKKFTTKVPPIRNYIKVASGLNPSESKKLEHVLNVTVQISRESWNNLHEPTGWPKCH